MYIATYVSTDPAREREIYRGPSHADAKRACAAALGYRDLRSAYSYTSEDHHGDDAVFFCRQRDSHRDDYACAKIVETVEHTIGDRGDYDAPA